MIIFLFVPRWLCLLMRIHLTEVPPARIISFSEGWVGLLEISQDITPFLVYAPHLTVSCTILSLVSSPPQMKRGLDDSTLAIVWILLLPLDLRASSCFVRFSNCYFKLQFSSSLRWYIPTGRDLLVPSVIAENLKSLYMLTSLYFCLDDYFCKIGQLRQIKAIWDYE